MDRAQLIAQAKAKYQREQLIAQAKAKYAASQAPAEVVQEMPEWLSSKDRLIAKNLAQSDEKQVEFLKKQYPDAEVRLENGQVQLRKGNTPWGVLDPNTGLFSKDILNDLGDIAYDIGSGAVEGTATGLGAVGGAAVGGGVGGIPGAMAASGVAGAGMEAFRQKLGQAIGIPQEVDMTDVAITGAVSTASPLLMGAGKTTTGAVAKLAKGFGVDDAALQAGEKAGRGLAERGWDGAKQTVLPKVGEWMSGKSADSIRAYADNADLVDRLEKDGVTDYIQATTNKVNNALQSARTKAGQAVSSAVDNANGVDLAAARRPFEERLLQLKLKPNKTPADLEEIQAIQSTFDHYFKGLPDKVSGGEAFDLQQKLKQEAKFGTNMKASEMSSKGVARGGYEGINEGLDDATNSLSTEVKREYQRVNGINDELERNFEDPQKTFNTLTGLDSRGRTLLKERLNKLAQSGELDITNEAAVMKAFSDFADPSMMPVGFKGTTSTTRSVPLGIAGASLGGYLGSKEGGTEGTFIGSGIGALAGGALGSPAMMKRIIKANLKANQLGSKIPGGAAFYANPATTDLVAPWLLMNNQNNN